MIILRSKRSRYYFKNFGVWTSDPHGAFAFTDESQARDFVRREHVEDVQVFEFEVLAPKLDVAA